jgi:CrcB protein
MNPELATTLWVALGGGMGSVVRYAIDVLFTRFAGKEVLWGTLLVNVLGSFLIGYLGMPVLTHLASEGPDLRLLLALGVWGGFTTFSCFSLQTIELLRKGQMGRAMAYAGGSVVLCLGAAALGLYAGDPAA